MVVDDVEILADEEVRRDQAPGPGELPLAPLDPPRHRAVLPRGVGTDAQERFRGVMPPEDDFSSGLRGNSQPFSFCPLEPLGGWGVP